MSKKSNIRCGYEFKKSFTKVFGLDTRLDEKVSDAESLVKVQKTDDPAKIYDILSESERVRLSWEFLNQIILRKCSNALEIVQSAGAKSG